ncbi:MAG TPA: chaperone NapD [Candidatus Krumholzibacteria bacterium]|jgi:nitrate reductase NapAB chaperone NapD|nr:chaperone NapD [Candidatus Krumholzibacteria bacterium]
METMLVASRIVEVEHGTAAEVEGRLERIPRLTILGRCREEHIVVVIEGHDREQVHDVERFARTEIPQIVTIDASARVPVGEGRRRPDPDH